MPQIFIALTALWLCAMPLRGQITVNGFDDIQFWSGLGANRSALVVEFDNGADKFSVAWGYRWSGDVNLQTMVFDLAGSITGGPAPVVGSDPRLSLEVSNFGSMGYFVDILTYDHGGLGGGWPTWPMNLTGWDGTNWNNLFTLEGSNIWSPGPFQLADVGMADTSLVDGGWYGWVMANGPQTYSFQQPVSAVPEPSAIALLATGAAFLRFFGRKSRR
jgi:hypothetical protein